MNFDRRVGGARLISGKGTDRYLGQIFEMAQGGWRYICLLKYPGTWRPSYIQTCVDTLDVVFLRDTIKLLGWLPVNPVGVRYSLSLRCAIVLVSACALPQSEGNDGIRFYNIRDGDLTLPRMA